MTWRQCEVWQSSVKLWRNQLRYEPKVVTWLSYCKLAEAYFDADNRIVSNAQRFNQLGMLYQKAIELKPDFHESYLGMGNLFGSIGDWANCEKYYKLAALYDQNNFEELFLLGNVYRKQGLPKKAIDLYRKALEENPYLCPDIRRAYKDSIQNNQNVEIYHNEEAGLLDCQKAKL